MLTAELVLQGVGAWAPRAVGWSAWRAALAAGRWPEGAAARPTSALLPPNERRRAPDAVLMALQVAEEACQAAGIDRAQVASVFVSAHGDQANVDALCRTLADDPALLSPMRFHHSVHNAAAGYWAMATGNRAAGVALAAGPHGLAAGLLEAACQVQADARPVLLVACDTAAPGLLQQVNPTPAPAAWAAVLAPPGAAGRRLHLQQRTGTPVAPGEPPALALAPDWRGHPLCQALELSAALADKASITLALDLGKALTLALTLAPG